ncbi:DUF4142 domain-containing protein [uncultured Sphingomonas sp.]|uniref:DUF4142 domain-containing protein n=1 Tax=uncultured Sphingomonas sp. TaxID=158754 RepID=UPI0035C9D2DC
MISKRHILLAASLALMVAAPATAQVMTPAEYVATAGASDLFERQSAQIVLETTTDANVRSFATMMLSAHAQSTAEVKAAAAKSKVPAPPPVLTPLQMEMIAELRAETGAARDALYIAQQKAAHGQALSVQQAYASGGTAAALRMAAAKIVPVVSEHIAMLMKM